MNPIKKFKDDWEQAKNTNDANAPYCTLATSKNGQCSVRILVLREVTDDSFSLFINETSPKWLHLQKYELLIFWPTLMIQYRVRGDFTEISSAKMEKNWKKKPYNSKIIDYYYTRFQSQSSVVNSREEFLKKIELLKQEFPENTELPFSQNAKGVFLRATQIEEWRGSMQDRLHERYLYRLNKGRWDKEVLIP